MELPKSEILASFGEEIEPIEDRPIAHEADLVEKMQGAGLWNIKKQDGSIDEAAKDKWTVVVNHTIMEYNLSIFVAKKLKEVGGKENVEELKDINLADVADGAFISDMGKRQSDDARALGLIPEDEDIHAERGYELAKQIGLPEHVARVALTHNFPTNEAQVPTWLDKIVLFADLHTSQKYMTVHERMEDIRTRWIKQRVEAGKKPLIDPEEFEKYAAFSEEVSRQIRGLIGMDDEEEFVKNIPIQREARYLSKLFAINDIDRAIEFTKKIQDRNESTE